MWWVLLRELRLMVGRTCCLLWVLVHLGDGLQLPPNLTVEKEMSHLEFIKQLCKGGGYCGKGKAVLYNCKIQG